MFEGFSKATIETSETTINLVRGGKGPPVLLLHGYPQTHVMWHKVAPRLAERFTVVATDLRGYGDSGKPPSGRRSERVLQAHHGPGPGRGDGRAWLRELPPSRARPWGARGAPAGAGPSPSASRRSPPSTWWPPRPPSKAWTPTLRSRGSTGT